MAEERLFALRQTIGANLDGEEKPPALKLLQAKQILGRSERSDFEIPVPTVSRRHAAVWVEDETPFVQDLDSGHGTFINSQRVTAQPVALKSGDLLGLGNEVTLVLSMKKVETPAEEALSAKPSGKMSPLVELALSEGTSEERLRQFFHLLIRLHGRMFELCGEDEVLDAVVDELWRGVEADRVIAFRGNAPDNLEAVTWRLRRDDEDPGHQPPSRSVLTRGLLASKPLITFDARNDQRFAQQASVEFSNIRSVMCVALRSPVGPCGLLYADTLGSTGLHSGDDANFITVVASCAGLKLHELRQRNEVSADTPSSIGSELKKHLSRLEMLANDIETERGDAISARLLRAECVRLRNELEDVASREHEIMAIESTTIGQPERFTSTQALSEIPEEE